MYGLGKYRLSECIWDEPGDALTLDFGLVIDALDAQEDVFQ